MIDWILKLTSDYIDIHMSPTKALDDLMIYGLDTEEHRLQSSNNTHPRSKRNTIVGNSH